MNSVHFSRQPLVPENYSIKRKKREEEKPGKIEKVRTRKVRVIEAFKNRNKIRLKDKNGNNVKQHFGIWKYFISTSTAAKEKFYISLDCRKFSGAIAFEAAKRDKVLKSEFMHKLGKIAAEGTSEELRYWGLPFGICAKFEALFHISKLYPWQIECLSQAAESEENLIYSVPTSGGKSLVAEIMMLRAVLCKKKRAMYVLPYISIVCEKAEYLKKLTEDVNVKIEQFHGLSDNVWSANVDIALATPEKANSVFNRLIEECNYDDIGYVIIDEFHLVSEPNRGAQIELLLAKILTLEKLYNKKIQVVTMTATISQLEVYQKWIRAKVYENKSRPVPLSEYVLSEGKLLNTELTQVATVPGNNELETVSNNNA